MLMNLRMLEYDALSTSMEKVDNGLFLTFL